MMTITTPPTQAARAAGGSPEYPNAHGDTNSSAPQMSMIQS